VVVRLGLSAGQKATGVGPLFSGLLDVFQNNQ